MTWSLTIDCNDPELLSAFWTEALGYRETSHGAAFAVLEPRTDGGGPLIFLQGVPEPKLGKNRLHIDMLADDIQHEKDRLVEVGAWVIESMSEHGKTWYIMADPEGNEFCVSPKA